MLLLYDVFVYLLTNNIFRKIFEKLLKSFHLATSNFIKIFGKSYNINKSFVRLKCCGK